MKHFFSDIKIFHWIGIITLTSVAFWSFNIVGYMIDPFGTIIIFRDIVFMVIISIFIKTRYILVLSLIVGLFLKKSRLLSKKILTFLALFVIINALIFRFYYPIVFRFSERIQIQRLAGVLEDNMHLVDAIREFEQSYGNPPKYLHDVIPEFLSGMPQDIDGNKVSYMYDLSPQETEWRGNSWMLTITIPVYFIKDVKFVYVSDNKYPEKYELMGEWIFVLKY